MTLAPPIGLSAKSIRAAVLAGEFTVAAITDAHLAHIAMHNSRLGAFQRVEAERAHARAAELDAAHARGEATGPLFGVPVALKANMCVEGEETNCGSRMLAGYRAPYTATFVQKLIDAGAVILGVTEMDEFGMGSSGEHSAFNCPRNPWAPSRTAGGSSSGAAVAVATRMVPIALGSDTGGSARQPAAFCGIYGLKPTYGRVSRYGLVAFGSSLDQVSPLAHTPGDLELLLEVLSGHDAFDSTSLPRPSFEPERPAEPQRLVGLRIGVLSAGPDVEIDPNVRSACDRELARLEGFGAELVPIDLPHAAYAIPTYYIVVTAEASSNLARYDGTLFGNRARGEGDAPTQAGALNRMFETTRRAGFGDEVKRRILLGTYALSAGYAEAWYAKAQRVRTLLCRDFDAAFADVDVIACPTSPTVAFPLGSKREDALAMYRSDELTVPASLAGLPAISIPVGLSESVDEAERLPIGMQLVAPALAEARLLRLATALAVGADQARPTPPLQGAH